MIDYGEMTYENRDGRQVALEGPVVIDGVLHRVVNRFVFCAPELNRRAWGFTMFASVCPACYPQAVECAKRALVQGELFA